MAINIYGSCSGSSGNKYDIWLNVKQNSQSIEDNKSNVTVKLYLKRNDGYSASAYNLTEGSNSVVLKVGGKEKVNKNLTIDTRNNAKVTLASWTGDVAHNSDGSLSLSVNGSFSMGGTSLSGGSASGSFNCTDIPRASTLTLSKSSLNPLDSVGATLSAASSSFSHKIKWSLGDSSVTHSLSAGITKDSFTVPISWAEEITNAKSGNITVALATYKGSKKIGSKSYTLKLTIPKTDEFLPEFNLVVTRIDNSVPEELGEYVKGKSQVKLNIENLNLKYGANASSYTAKVDTVSKTKLPATFDLTKSGELTVSVTVKDSRGLSVTKTSKINVLGYSAPTVSVKNLYRCDSLGNKNNAGTYLFCNLNIKTSSLNGKNVPQVIYKYKKSNELFSGEMPIEENPLILGNGEFLNGSSYTLAFKITDSITKNNSFIEAIIPSSDIPFNIRKGGKGASFGCFSERDNELTVGWNLNVKGGIVYENAVVETSSYTTDKRGVARYIPCLELVFVRLRFDVSKVIPANESHVIATFSNKIPSLASPVNVIVNTGISHNCNGYIKSDTGDLVINSDNKINVGDSIYVSGVYYAYR